MIVTEWEVWLADESTRDSRRHTWDDDWDGVLVVRWWGPSGKGINWGDGRYGLSRTIKNGVLVADDVFARVMRASRAANVPPSKRKR
jgi:hypothetical protein